ncbi:MAG: glycosyltransferase family 87 protein [Sphingomicrobium sp.]
MPFKAAAEEPVSRQLRWHRAAAIGFATLFVLSAVWGYWLGRAQPRPVDFLSFWAAGRLALHGKAALAYNLVWHRFVEQTAAPIKGLLPFPYPPPFLLVVSPFALLPYWTALAFWVIVTAIIYLAAVRKFAPLPYSLAHPAVPVNSWIGQNGFLTCGIFALGLAALDVSPVAGGAIFGLLIIKPQLALLIPIAFVAGRQWWGIAGAASGALLLLAIGYALFGPSSYEGFVQALPHQASVIANGRVPWNELASPFAFCRLLGIPREHSLAVQAVVAILAGAVTWRAWWLGLNSRGPVLAAATLLIPPYLFTYDSLLLMIPIGWLVRCHAHPVGLAIIWLLCLLPVISYSGAYTGPNTIPLAAVLCLWLLHVDEKSRKPENALPTHPPMSARRKPALRRLDRPRYF